MKTLKLILLVMILLAFGMLTGCHEGHSHQAGTDITIKRQVVWEPTQTGFWHPKVPYTEVNHDR